MGASMSTLSIDDIEDLTRETSFKTHEIQRLYRRFTMLDKDNSGTLSPAEFLAIPEFSMNPLSQRILSLFQLEQLEQTRARNIIPEDHVEVDFRAFVKTLFIFSKDAQREDKIKFAFRIYNVSNDGFIKPGELFSLVRCMVGDHIHVDRLKELVERTLQNSKYQDIDERISYEEFRNIMNENELPERMQLSFQ
jgi:serine/threonine-protein phosphatase 2B regulatory subunit